MFKFILFLDKHKVGCNFSSAGILVADKGFGFAMILVVAGIQCGGASQNKKIYTPKIYITSDKKYDGLETTPLQMWLSIS